MPSMTVNPDFRYLLATQYGDPSGTYDFATNSRVIDLGLGDWKIAGTTVSPTANELNRADTDDKFTFLEDFEGTWLITDAGPADYFSSTAGSGATPVIATTVSASINGEVTLKSAADDGTDAANGATFTHIGLDCKANQGGLAFETRLKVDDVSETYLFVGFTDTISTTVEFPIDLEADVIVATATNACGILYDVDSTTNEFAQGGVKAGAVTLASFSGSLPVDATYVVLRVEVSATGGVRGFINGTAIAAETANAVTITTALTPAIIIGNRSANQVIATIDYWKVEQDR